MLQLRVCRHSVSSPSEVSAPCLAGLSFCRVPLLREHRPRYRSAPAACITVTDTLDDWAHA
jgi:hypothetical protein